MSVFSSNIHCFNGRVIRDEQVYFQPLGASRNGDLFFEFGIAVPPGRTRFYDHIHLKEKR